MSQENTRDTNNRSLENASEATDAALEKCAQELKALALIYQAYNRPRWAREAYRAFLNATREEQIESHYEMETDDRRDLTAS